MFEWWHISSYKMACYPAKTQISLHNLTVWSESSLCILWIAKDSNHLHEARHDSNQTAQMHKLIWVFAGHTCKIVGIAVPQLIYTRIIVFIFSNICAKNYRSVTDLGFQPYKENSGREPLPYSCYQVGSGFVRQKPITTPTDRSVSLNIIIFISPTNWVCVGYTVFMLSVHPFHFGF